MIFGITEIFISFPMLNGVMVILMDVWSKVESNLAAIKLAGVKIVGEELPRLPCGGPSKEEQMAAYQRAERIRLWARWPGPGGGKNEG
jgi:hypothetical protein